MPIYAGGVWLDSAPISMGERKDPSAQRRYFKTNYKYNARGIGKIEIGTYNLIEDIFNCLNCSSYTTKELANNLKINEDELQIGFNYFISCGWAIKSGLIRKKWSLTAKGRNFFNTFMADK